MFYAQIHLHKNGDVRIFSRNCEERTSSFPDVADAVRSAAAGAILQHFFTTKYFPCSLPPFMQIWGTADL